ncbi:hypothetical protein OPV22_001281 [Ensete ventricosum]|uniref:Transposase (putative) gypsy type domain-containing protein n=1 Tax=Ensete ventricosum TaxID=4639 RepID=A0AAV8RW52_ENSVE|nr:hypothetical protein OPV22_001281 [Ensete ventricosum]
MMSHHDLDSAVTEVSLAAIRARYSIPAEYGLYIPEPGQRPYSLDVPGMCISVDALEAGLRFPLHPLIEECLKRWRISPSQVAPNSWRYLVVFLGECRGAGIIPTRDLFMTCFRLCKSRGGYYLTARVGFRVSGAPSSNKGWKSRYLYVSGLGWGFGFSWSAHPIGNAPPYLSEEEAVLVGRLKGILSSSCAIKEMTELWLVEAGLSPASKDRMDLGDLRGMPRVAGGRAPPSRPSAREASTSPAREAPRASAKRPASPSTEHAGATGKPVKRVKVLSRKHKSSVGEGGSRPRSKGKEPAASPARPEAPVESEEGAASPVPERPRSMKDLFRTKVYKGDQGYYALMMSDLGHQDPEKELQARWAGLKNSTKVWHTSSAAEEYERGILHPGLARELYTLPSEVLMARATKELVLSQHLQMALVDRVHDVGRLITFMDHRVKQQQEELDVLKSKGGPEAVAEAEERASRLQEELEKIKAEKAEELLRHEASEKELRGHLGDAHHLLKEARARARRMDDDLLQSVKDLEQARAELPRTAVAEYKESLGFKEGLKRMGRVTYEYEYRVARARFRARHPDADVEEDPFTIYPEDDSVPMERRQDFDDSTPPVS